MNGGDQRVGGHVAIDVQDLAVGRLSQWRDNRNVPGLGDGAHRVDVHSGHVTDHAVLIAVLDSGLKYPAGQRRGVRTGGAQRTGQAQVLGLEHAPRHAQNLGRGDTQAVALDGLYAVFGQGTIELRSTAVNDDGGQAHLLQERQRRGQIVELRFDDRPAHFDHREFQPVQVAEALQVLLHFLR